MPEDFKLIVITSEKNITGEALLINELFNAGMQLLHVRKPANSLEELRTLLSSISNRFHSKIVIHNRYELTNEFNLKGIHLSETKRKERNSNSLKNIVSSSFHRLDELLQDKINFEYVIYSPVFQSISKQGYTPSVKPEILKDFLKSNKNKIKYPVIALGGITGDNIMQAVKLGFNGAACIGYIWENSNPIEQFNKLQNKLQG